MQEQIALGQKIEELQNSEYAYEPETAEDDGVLYAWEEEGEIHRQYGEQVDDAENAEYVFSGILGAIDTQDVLSRKEEGKEVLKNDNCGLEPLCLEGTAENGYYNADGYADHQHYVEQFAFTGIRFEDYVVQLILSFLFAFHVSRMFIKRKDSDFRSICELLLRYDRIAVFANSTVFVRRFSEILVI